LRHGGTRSDLATANDVANLETDDIATTELAIDRDIEMRAVTELSMVIEIEADAPYLLRLQRPLCQLCGLRSKLAGRWRRDQIRKCPSFLSYGQIGHGEHADSDPVLTTRRPDRTVGIHPRRE
jgi:hypothetical protein